MKHNLKTDFDNTYSELDALYESGDREAAKAFWANAKNNIIDAESFHKAYDDEIDADTQFDLFGYNSNGALLHKGTYGKIKDLDPDLFSTKALKKMWAMQFKDGAKTLDQINKQKAAEEAREKARLEKEQKIKDLTQRFEAKLDMPTIEKSLELAKNEADYKAPYYDADYNGYSFSKVLSLGISHYFLRGSDYTPEKAAEYINEVYAENLELLQSRAKFIRAEWYKPFKKFISENEINSYNQLTVYFQDKDKNFYKVEMHSDFWSKLAELPDSIYPVITDMYQDGHSMYTNRDSTYVHCYSVSNEATPEALKAAGVSLDPAALGRQPGNHSHSEYKERTLSEATKDGRYLIDGMDRWFIHIWVDYATD